MRYNEINSIINGLFKPSTRDDLSHLCSSLCIARGFSAMRASRWPNPSNWRVWNTSVQEKHGETIHVNSIDTKSPSVENNMPNFIEQNTPSYHISAQPFLLTSPGFTPLVSLSHPFQLGVQCSNDSNASSFFLCVLYIFLQGAWCSGSPRKWVSAAKHLPYGRPLAVAIAGSSSKRWPEVGGPCPSEPAVGP